MSDTVILPPIDWQARAVLAERLLATFAVKCECGSIATRRFVWMEGDVEGDWVRCDSCPGVTEGEHLGPLGSSTRTNVRMIPVNEAIRKFLDRN